MNEVKQTVALVAPGFAASNDVWDNVLSSLRARGYGVKAFGQYEPAQGRFAGTDAARASHLMDAFLDPDIDVIMCMRGGGGCSRLLDLLDFNAIRRDPKTFIGYSDVTSLHMALATEADNPVIHGPMGIDLVGASAERSFEVFADILSGRFDAKLTERDGICVAQAGRFSGPLMGGNLTVFLSLIGTPEFHVPDRCVLFFEDVGEHDFRMDRAFVQLRRSGILQKAGAFLFGHTRLAGSDEPDAFRDLAMGHLDGFGGPIVFDIPSAHQRMNLALPINQVCQINAISQSLDLRFTRTEVRLVKPGMAI